MINQSQRYNDSITILAMSKICSAKEMYNKDTYCNKHLEFVAGKMTPADIVDIRRSLVYLPTAK